MSPTPERRRSPWTGLGWLTGMLGFAVAALLLAAPAQAQQAGRVTGEVINESSGEPLVGAQVIVEGTDLGTVTNNRGQFLLPNVPAGTHTIAVQLIGYSQESQQVTVSTGSATTVTFEIRSEAISLEGVIATGTPGQARRREVGNSIEQITADRLETAAIGDMGDVLQGRTVGTTVMDNSGMVGAGSTIRLRGNNSIEAGNSPLIYVDGIRIDNGTYASDPETNQAPSALDDISPQDIERIEIVKGAAATTLYGTEAANGVVQIFTKSGAAGSPQWSLSIDQGINNLGHVGPEMDPTGLGLNDCTAEPNCPESGTWLRNGHVQRYNMSVRGGSEDISYYLSGNVGRSQGVIAPQGMDDYGLRGNFSFNPTDDLEIRFNNAYKRRNITWIPDGNNAEGFTLNVMRGDAGYTPDNDNALALNMRLGQAIDHFSSALNITWNPTDGIVHRLNTGIDWNTDDYTEERPWGFWYDDEGARENDIGHERNLTLDYSGSWNKTGLPADLSSTFSWGAQLYDEFNWGLVGFGNEFAGPGDKVVQSGAIQSVSETRRRVTSGGFFFQEQLGWNDRLFLTGGARWDGFSTFGAGFGMAVYPKLSGAYTISDHDFWPGWWETMKIRAAVGESGKAPGTFEAERLWFTTTGDENEPAVSISNLGNPELGPERTREYEAGFEGALLEGRLSYSFSYYNQHTYDGLVDVLRAPSLGTEQRTQMNVGEFRSTGTELSLNLSLIQDRDVAWDVGGRFSTSNSKVLDLGGLESVSIGWRNEVRPCADSDDPGTDYINEAEDCPIPGFYHWDVTNPDAVGAEPEWEYRLIGPTYPTHQYGINTTLTLNRRVTLDLLGEGQGGHVLSSGVAHQNTRREAWPPCYDTQEKVENGNTSDVTALELAKCDPDRSEYGVWTLPADFIKLRSASLSYRLPEALLPAAAGGATIQLMGRNLITSTDWPGLDPEADEDNSFSRQEYYNIPPMRSFMLNLRVNF